MKTLNEYIKESILDDEDVLLGSVKDNMVGQTIYNKLVNKEKLTKDELKWIESNIGVFKVDYNQLKNLIKCLNIYNISLNWLDVSNVTDMSFMFYESNFNGDISEWNVSRVKSMYNMFNYSKFNGDISKWNVSNVRSMNSMFANSKFNSDISKWDVSNIKYTYEIFTDCPIKEEYKSKFK